MLISSRMAIDDIDALTEAVIGHAMTVHSALGPGLLESIYRDCLALELTAHDFQVEGERRVPIIDREHRIRDDLRIDLLVDGRLIVEVKSVDRLHPIYRAQLIAETGRETAASPAGMR